MNQPGSSLSPAQRCWDWPPTTSCFPAKYLLGLQNTLGLFTLGGKHIYIYILSNYFKRQHVIQGGLLNSDNSWDVGVWKAILLCKGKHLFNEWYVTSELFWGKNFTNQTCGPLETEATSCQRPSSQWPFPLTAFVPVPVFADLCRISFSACLPVLRSDTVSAGLCKTRSALEKHNREQVGHPPSHWSPHVLPLGFIFCCYCCLFVIWKVNCTFKE